MDDECHANGSLVVDCLWYVLESWDPAWNLSFVRFFSGTNRLPLKQTEFLRIEMPFTAFTASERILQLGMLPQVSSLFDRSFFVLIFSANYTCQNAKQCQLLKYKCDYFRNKSARILVE